MASKCKMHTHTYIFDKSFSIGLSIIDRSVK